MTTQPTTGPTAADTTTSARETLHHLAHLTADPYIPEVHDDEDDTDTTALDLDDIATRAAHLAEYTDLPAAADLLAGQDVPALLAAVDRLRAERDDLAARIDYWREGYRIARHMTHEEIADLEAGRARLRAVTALPRPDHTAPAGAEDGDRRA